MENTKCEKCFHSSVCEKKTCIECQSSYCDECGICAIYDGAVNKECVKNCKDFVDADSINRHKSEIKRLKEENDELKNGFFQEYYKTQESQELLSIREAWRKAQLDYITLNAEWEGKYNTAIIEAIKEFSEELKGLSRRMYPLFDDPIIECKDIDKLVNKRIGDKNEKM